MRTDTTSQPGGRTTDTVDRELSAWLAELPGVDADIEAARMRLLRLGRQLERLLGRIAQDFGMTIGDWETLSVLRRSALPYQLSPTALARALSVTSGTMSVRVDRLLEAGLVEPVEGASDGRSRPVRLTRAGHERWEAATRKRTELERQLIGRALTGRRTTELNSLLRSVMASFEEGLGPAPPRPDRRDS
jgi:DNA-binding MarR family transcriptional regulator